MFLVFLLIIAMINIISLHLSLTLFIEWKTWQVCKFLSTMWLNKPDVKTKSYLISGDIKNTFVQHSSILQYNVNIFALVCFQRETVFAAAPVELTRTHLYSRVLKRLSFLLILIIKIWKYKTCMYWISMF